MQRDQPLWRDAAVDVVIDTFGDRRDAYVFETNQNGARTDGLISDEGRNFNISWNGVWQVASRRTSEGWFAEMAIPFSTLRFDPAATAWGVNVKPFAVGRDAKWAPVRAVSVDLTVNIDFGETEADDLQTNLTRFSLFQAEKRDFSLENSGIFAVGSGAAGAGALSVMSIGAPLEHRPPRRADRRRRGAGLRQRVPPDEFRRLPREPQPRRAVGDRDGRAG